MRGGAPMIATPTLPHELLATLTLVVNGKIETISVGPAQRLSKVLREQLGLTGTKVGCDAGDCGACTVLLAGEPICSCLVPVAQAEGREITTVEGLAHRPPLFGRLQTAFLCHGAAQCGACTPGMLVSATALLEKCPTPSENDVMDAIGGVLCRCTGYRKIVAAVLDAHSNRQTTATPEAGAAVGCPHHRARFQLGDVDAFLAAHPGIVAVFTSKDVPGEDCYGVIPTFAEQTVFA